MKRVLLLLVFFIVISCGGDMQSSGGSDGGGNGGGNGGGGGIRIRTAAELNNIRNNLSGQFILANDISLSAYNSGAGTLIRTSNNAKQILRDSKGVKRGEINEQGGKLILRDAKGIKRGEYDPKTNTTRDAKGIKVGTGNLLTTLLP